MRGFPLISGFVSVTVLYISLVCVESKDFCQSYKENNYSLIVFSQSNDTILLFIDKYMWRLREDNSRLDFDPNDFQAFNSSEELSQMHYSWANAIYNLSDPNFRGIAFYQDQNFVKNVSSHMLRYFRIHYYYFRENNVKFMGTDKSVIDDKSFIIMLTEESLPETRFAFTIFDEKTDVIIRLFNKKNLILTIFTQCSMEGLKYSAGPKDNKIYQQLVNLNESLHRINTQIIGTYLNSEKKIIFFFKIEDAIKYCSIDRCISGDYEVLINCYTKTTSSQFSTPALPVRFVPNIWIFIGLTVVVVVVFAIIGAIVFYFTRDKKTDSTTIYKPIKYSTIKTLDTKTGLPKDKLKEDMNIKVQSISMSTVSEDSNTNVKQVSSPKSQKPKQLEKLKPVKKALTLKPKKPSTPGKMKAKKSPQTKK